MILYLATFVEALFDVMFFCAVLLILRNMLLEPNVDSPLEEEVAEQYRNKKADFIKTAKEWTKKYASK